MHLRASLILAALVALPLTSCATADDGAVDGASPGDATGAAATAPDGPVVVATTTILGDVVDQIVGDHGQVDVLMAPGQDPHGFSPSAQQAQLLREADLIVANGLGLEEAALDVIEAAEADGVPVLHVAEHVEPMGVDENAEDDEHADEHAEEETHADEHAEEEHADEETHDESDHGHAHDEGDPHFWFDPLRMADGARAIGHALAELDGDDDWEDRAEQVATSLEATHEDVAAILAEVPDACRTLVSNHDNLSYLAARYEFEIVGTVLPGTSTAAEPSAQEFAQLAELLRETNVPAIFVETTQTSRLAESLAAEVGRDVAIVELYTDALGEPGSGADTYAGLLTTDARLIADALGDC